MSMTATREAPASVPQSAKTIDVSGLARVGGLAIGLLLIIPLLPVIGLMWLVQLTEGGSSAKK